MSKFEPDIIHFVFLLDASKNGYYMRWKFVTISQGQKFKNNCLSQFLSLLLILARVKS